MKKAVIVCVMFLMILSTYAETDCEPCERYTKSPTYWYNRNLKDIESYFTAQKILMGNIELLDTEEISNFSLALLEQRDYRFLRNMIYARYGYIFKSEDLTRYYCQFEWYKPERNNVDSSLTELDKKNIAHIQMFEAMNDDLPAIANAEELIGFWLNTMFLPNTFGGHLIFNKNNKVSFENGDFSRFFLPLLFGWDGVYNIKGNVLRLEINNIDLCKHTMQIKPDFNPASGDAYDWIAGEVVKYELPSKITMRMPLSQVVNIKMEEYGFEIYKRTIGFTDMYKYDLSVLNQ